MSAPTWHRDLPYREFMRGWRWMRRQFFTASPSEGKYYYIDDPEVDVLRLKHALGNQSYSPGHRFSYDKGEDLNLRRIWYQPYRDEGVEWWQTHVRVWEDDGIWVYGHVEPTPEDHPKAHFDKVGFSIEEAMSDISRVLTKDGIEFERRQYGV